eukprot:19310-Heterococcus_DN1.PRE.3
MLKGIRAAQGTQQQQRLAAHRTRLSETLRRIVGGTLNFGRENLPKRLIFFVVVVVKTRRGTAENNSNS